MIAGGSGSNSDKHCISRTNRRACADKNLNSNFKICSKRKASTLSGCKSNNNHNNTKSLPRNKCKIAIWATAYKRRLTTIQNLKAKLREHESKVEKAYSSYMEKALAAAKKESDEIIQNLQSRVVEYEAKLIHRDEIHKQLKESYQRLKNDYECEVENHFNDVENILSKSCEQSFSSFTDNCAYLSKFDYNIEKIKLRDGKDIINPYVMKTLCILRVALQLSLRKCIIALVLVGQHMFKQKDCLNKRIV